MNKIGLNMWTAPKRVYKRVGGEELTHYTAPVLFPHNINHGAMTCVPDQCVPEGKGRWGFCVAALSPSPCLKYLCLGIVQEHDNNKYSAKTIFS